MYRYNNRYILILFARDSTDLQHQLLFGGNSKTVIIATISKGFSILGNKINGVIYRFKWRVRIVYQHKEWCYCGYEPGAQE
jgi:hypothetical protein